MMENRVKRLIVFLVLLSWMGCSLGANAAHEDAMMQTGGMATMHQAGFEDPYRTCTQRCQARCEPGHWNTGMCKDLCVFNCYPPPGFLWSEVR